jgi:2-deoxy-D-gluconate 3-dehydrogenase
MSIISSLFDVTGKTAIVTGASRGLGAAAATALASAGANVVMVGRELKTLKQQESALGGTGVRLLSLQCDLAHPEQIAETVQKGREAVGEIDILVNNAGIIRRSPAEQYALEDWQAVLDVNLTGMFVMAQEVGRGMIERGRGKIINIASLLSFSGGLNVAAYTASKSGVAGITKALANEWGRFGVTVNAIAPGYFNTEATAALRSDEARYSSLTQRIPLKRWGEPEELYGTFLYLASNASNYVNGHVLVVDGGWMAA